MYARCEQGAVGSPKSKQIIEPAANPAVYFDPLVFDQEYLTERIGEFYRRQQQVSEHADIVVGGLQPPD